MRFSVCDGLSVYDFIIDSGIVSLPVARQVSTGIRPRDLFILLQSAGSVLGLSKQRCGQVKKRLREVGVVSRNERYERLFNGLVHGYFNYASDEARSDFLTG